MIFMKTVSIVIPTYKRPSMITRAINSVLSQNYSAIEIIVVDDNDPDSIERKETEEAMLAYADKHSVVYLRHPSNKGGSAARNTGWQIASGEYITFLDDDDEISPKKIELQVACLESKDEEWGACYTSYHILMPNGTIQRSATTQEGDVYIRALMRTLYMGSGSNVLYRKRIVDAVGGYDESFKRNQDIEFMARCFEICKVAYVPEDLLTVHFEVRQFKRSFDFVDGVTAYYLEKFSHRINALGEHDRHRVLSVITLDRARVAVKLKRWSYAMGLLRNNGVTTHEFFLFILYLIHRVLTGKSYGFYLK